MYPIHRLKNLIILHIHSNFCNSSNLEKASFPEDKVVQTLSYRYYISLQAQPSHSVSQGKNVESWTKMHCKPSLTDKKIHLLPDWEESRLCVAFQLYSLAYPCKKKSLRPWAYVHTVIYFLVMSKFYDYLWGLSRKISNGSRQKSESSSKRQW